MKKLWELYKRFREPINYLIFGGLTTLVSLATYALFVEACGLGVVLSQALSWVCAVIFAFVTNKLWVFFSTQLDARTLLSEAAKFFGARAATGVIELAGLPLLMRWGLDQPLLGVEGFAAKVIVTVVVIILNYIFSKFLVFKKTEE